MLSTLRSSMRSALLAAVATVGARAVMTSPSLSFADMTTGSTTPGRKRAGISMARQQRAARKARNVARNRRQHR